MVQILLIRPWHRVPHTINFRRGWVKELNLSELGWFGAWTIITETRTQEGISREILFPEYRYICLVPFLWGTPLHYIGPFL